MAESVVEPGPVRAYPRLPDPFPARWRQHDQAHRAVASGISVSGCFLRALHAVPPPGSDLDVTLVFPSGAVTLAGQTVWAEAGRGFGVRFRHQDPAGREALVAHLVAAGLREPTRPPST